MFRLTENVRISGLIEESKLSKKNIRKRTSYGGNYFFADPVVEARVQG